MTWESLSLMTSKFVISTWKFKSNDLAIYKFDDWEATWESMITWKYVVLTRKFSKSDLEVCDLDDLEFYSVDLEVWKEGLGSMLV